MQSRSGAAVPEQVAVTGAVTVAVGAAGDAVETAEVEEVVAGGGGRRRRRVEEGIVCRFTVSKLSGPEEVEEEEEDRRVAHL